MIEKRGILKSALYAIEGERKLIFYMIYYAILEGVLILSIPLASSLVINSIIAHASFSVLTISFIIFVLFLAVMFIKSIQEYIVEKFKQKLFVEKSIDIVTTCLKCPTEKVSQDNEFKKLNFFFEIIMLQKIFPKFILNSVAIFIDITIGLILLLAFSILLFEVGLVLVIYFGILILLGFNGIKYAMLHSDLKYETFFFVKEIPVKGENIEEKLSKLDRLLNKYLDVRNKLFKVILRQKMFSFFIQALIYGLFFVFGSFLVINGQIPVGEFVAAEIIVVYINYAIKGLIKEIDSFYDITEGFYKLGKLESFLKGSKDE